MKPFRSIARFARTRRVLALVLVIGGCSATVAGATAIVVTSGLLASSNPTLTHATCTLTASSADTFVDEASKTTVNSASTTIATNPQSSATKRRRIYIQFNLASCATAIPARAEIDSATLTLTTTAAPANARTLSVWRVTSAWAVLTTTWNLQPTVATTATSTLAVAATSGAKAFDVTNDINDYVQSAPVPTPPPYGAAVTNLGWMIDDEGTSINTTDIFASNENVTVASRPKLVINYGS